eukprot:753466-Pyramimonas_sp.AAC.1
MALGRWQEGRDWEAAGSAPPAACSRCTCATRGATGRPPAPYWTRPLGRCRPAAPEPGWWRPAPGRGPLTLLLPVL